MWYYTNTAKSRRADRQCSGQSGIEDRMVVKRGPKGDTIHSLYGVVEGGRKAWKEKNRKRTNKKYPLGDAALHDWIIPSIWKHVKDSQSSDSRKLYTGLKYSKVIGISARCNIHKRVLFDSLVSVVIYKQIKLHCNYYYYRACLLNCQ